MGRYIKSTGQYILKELIFYETQVNKSIHHKYESIYIEGFFKITIMSSMYRYICGMGRYIIRMSQLISVWSRLQNNNLSFNVSIHRWCGLIHSVYDSNIVCLESTPAKDFCKKLFLP